MKLPATLAAALLATAAIAHAGGVGGYVAHIDTKDLGNNTGFGAKLQVDLASNVGLDLAAAWHSGLEDTVAGTKVDMELVPIELGLVVGIGVADQRVTPYIGVGGGYYKLGLDDNDPFSDDDFTVDDVFGWYGVAGLNIAIGQNLTLFGEGRYRQIEGTLENRTFTRQDELDLDLGGVALNAGLMLSW